MMDFRQVAAFDYEVFIESRYKAKYVIVSYQCEQIVSNFVGHGRLKSIYNVVRRRAI